MQVAASQFIFALTPEQAGQLPQNTVWVGLLCLGVYAIALAVEKGVSIWSKIRKNPPDHQTYATKNELREVELRLERRIGEQLGGINTRLSGIESTMHRLSQDFARSIGFLEGRTEHISDD